MDELVEFIASNDYVIYSLIGLLGVLVILFFVVLFSGKKTVKNDTIDDNIDSNLQSDDNANIDFDHQEYVKETTAEFELAPISEVMPNTSEEIPEVKEESPAIEIGNSKDEPVLKDFSFDELSKSISEELDKLKESEDKKEVEEESKDESIEDLPEISITKFDEIAEKVDTSEPVFITEKPTIKEEKEVELPKKVEEEKEEKNEPVIKEEEVPLFARFNNETYDLNKKD